MDRSPAIVNFTITNTDTTPPETTLTAGPPSQSWIAETSASFSFVLPEATATFECEHDSAMFTSSGWRPCTSPIALTGLDQGFHWFRVRAKDAANNVDPTPEATDYWVDTIPRSTGIVSGPTSGSTRETLRWGRRLASHR